MNWVVLIIVGLATISFIAFLVWRNRKDQQQFEDQLNNDYHKSKDEEGETPIDETMK